MDKVQIIAEAGVNHNGSMELAKRLVDAACEAGVDIVKFQTGIPEKLISRHARKAEYQITNTGSADESQLEMIRKITLTFDQHRELMDYCRAKGIEYLSTPFDLPSIDFLKSCGCSLWKIPSGEITNYPYLKKIGTFNDRVIMSTGMSDMAEIDAALSLLADSGQDLAKVTVLHCNTEYPTPMADVNLRAMDTIRRHTGLNVGYSDHTRGIEVPIAAVALGASVIEKHFTLDRTLPGPDHRASLEPDELTSMVKAIRNVELALGSDSKKVTDSERRNIAIARKSIVAARPIKCGEIFTEENLTTKRPGDGISAMRWPEIIGRKAVRGFEEDELIEI